jgi:hypothetical protein
LTHYPSENVSLRNTSNIYREAPRRPDHIGDERGSPIATKLQLSTPRPHGDDVSAARASANASKAFARAVALGECAVGAAALECRGPTAARLYWGRAGEAEDLQMSAPHHHGQRLGQFKTFARAVVHGE